MVAIAIIRDVKSRSTRPLSFPSLVHCSTIARLRDFPALQSLRGKGRPLLNRSAFSATEEPWRVPRLSVLESQSE